MELPEGGRAAEEERSLTRLFDLHEERRLRAQIEAALFASPEPVSQLARALEEPEELVLRLLEQLVDECERPERGVFVRRMGARYALASKPAHQEFLQEFLRGLRPRAPLSLPALQTLAIIAYKQPISAPEIQAIRRVAGAGVLTTLSRRKLIAPAGRQKDGNALLYRTTELFLKDFGLQQLKDLPNLEKFAEVHQIQLSSKHLLTRNRES